MDQQSIDAVAKAVLFANGLRKSITVAGRRWTQWPGGTNQLAKVIACVDRIQQRLQPSLDTAESAAAVATCISDLRAVLEWTSYQSASLATARAIIFARKARTFAQRFGLLDDRDTSVSILGNSESSLIANVQERNGHMLELAERNPHIELPQPLVDVASLAPKIERTAGKLALIQQLLKSVKPNPRKK